MISVIMLTYNREKFIKGMIQDVLEQTYSDFEFIIVDNGSTDGSGEIADEYAKKDARIQCIHLPRAESIGKGRNIGLQASHGEFITYVDDDDHLEKDFLQFLYDMVVANDADISMCGATELLHGEIAPQCLFEEKFVLSADEAVRMFLERKNIRAGMPTKLIRRNILLRYPFLENVKHEDIHTIYKYLADSKCTVLHGIPKYCFVRHGDNISYFTSDASRITPSQLEEYLSAFHERTIYLNKMFSGLQDLPRYSEWSYMLSMCDKIMKFDLTECRNCFDSMKEILRKNYDVLSECPYLKEFERTILMELSKDNGEKMIFSQVTNCKSIYDEELALLKNGTVVLFGAGSTSEFILKQFRTKGVFPVAFCDNSSMKIGKEIMDIRIISLQALKKMERVYIYITTQLYYSAIREQLIKEGINSELIMNGDLIYQFAWEEEVNEYYRCHENELDMIDHELADEKSKKVLCNRLKFLVTRDRNYILEIRDNCQYFDKKILSSQTIENFIDIGTYTGDSIQDFIKYKHGVYKHIWGFEPDSTLYQKAKLQLEAYSNITLVQKGTSNFNGELVVNSSLGDMQSVANEYWNIESEIESKFEVCCIDDYFNDIVIDSSMVKLDIEGAELRTLEGMKHFIEINKPIVAIAVYHKIDDIFTIPKILKEYNPMYKFYLRHYSDNQTETVLYAVNQG